MNLRKQLAALFLPTRRLTGTDPDLDAPDAIVQQGGALGGQQWVVPRALCQYRRVDLAAVPQRQRHAAARLAATRYQPASDSLVHTAWHRGIAHLWIWTAPPPEVAAGEQRWVPESLLRAPPGADGPRLLALVRGCEGQVWEDGQLLQSQWWPTPPDAGAWQRFLRAGGLDSGTAVPPAAEALAWSPAWGEGGREWLPGSAAGRERLAWLALGAVFCMALGWQLAGLARWGLASASLAAELERTRTQMAPVLAARERAEAAQAEAERLRGLQSGASDYELAARIVAAQPEGIRLGGWKRDANALQVLLVGGDTDPRKYVAAYAGQPGLADASATPLPTGMQLVFKLPKGEVEP